MRKQAAGLAFLSLLVCGGWLLTSEDVRIFPVRNTLQYEMLQWWWDAVGYPAYGAAGQTGDVSGTVRTATGQPLRNAPVVLTRWDGTRYHTRTGTDSTYRVAGIPAGIYTMVIGSYGYAPHAFEGVEVKAAGVTTRDVALQPLIVSPPPFAPTLTITLPDQKHCDQPLASDALRRTITIRPDQSPEYPFYLYTPISATTNSRLPVLLTLYPGPAEGWDCVSVPLAKSGYAVLAYGTQHRLDLDTDVALVKELLQLVRQGQIPNTDGSRIAVLGGSYSAFHAQRLLQDDVALKAGVLLGAPTDLFDMRRLFEEGSFVPPYGLDKALIAMGFPDREALRYWTYSAAYHVHSEMAPQLLVHSRADDIVPYQQSTLLAEQLDAVGVPYELHFFDGASHYLLEGDTDALEIYDLTLAFLRKYLG